MKVRGGGGMGARTKGATDDSFHFLFGLRPDRHSGIRREDGGGDTNKEPHVTKMSGSEETGAGWGSVEG